MALPEEAMRVECAAESEYKTQTARPLPAGISNV